MSGGRGSLPVDRQTRRVNIDVVPASPEDDEALSAMAAAAITEQLPVRGGTVWGVRELAPRPAPEAFAAVRDRGGRMWLAKLDGATVGYAGVEIERLADGTSLGIVTDLYTVPEAREVGVGEALISTAISYCEDRGCIGIDSLALPGNRHTKNFFETFGFKTRLLVVHRPLEGGS